MFAISKFELGGDEHGDRTFSPTEVARRTAARAADDQRRAQQKRVVGYGCERDCNRRDPRKSVQRHIDALTQQLSAARRDLRGATHEYKACLTRCPVQSTTARMSSRKFMQPIARRGLKTVRPSSVQTSPGTSGLGLSIEQAWERGLSMAQEFLHEHVTPQPILDLETATRRTAAAEEHLRDSLRILASFETAGVATPEDYAAYNRLQANLVHAQTRVLVATRRVFRNRADVLSRLPVKVRKAPPVAPPGSLSGFGGFGAAPVTAVTAVGTAGAATLAPWMIAAIIIVAILAVGAMVFMAATTVGVTAETVRDVVVVRSQSEAYLAMMTARQQVYSDCMAAGGSSEECAAQSIDAVPTPADSAAPLPEPPGAWVPWVVLGLAVVGGIWVYFDVQKRRDHRFMMQA